MQVWINAVYLQPLHGLFWGGLFEEVRKTCIFPLFIIQCLTHTEKSVISHFCPLFSRATVPGA